jgi:adenylate cyclase
MSGGIGRFLADLKRRHIYRVAAVYAVVAWIVIQLAGNLTPMLRLPEWAGSFVLVLLLVGFPIALLFAWIHELPAAEAEVATAVTTKLDWVLAGAVVLVLGGLFYQLLADSTDAAQPVTAAAPQAGGISVAVLPLANASGDSGQEYLSDGITDEIASALARVPSLRLVGRSSAYQFKGQAKDLRAIGQTLGATYLIDGSLRRDGNRVRVTAALIKADDGISVWTDTYNRELTDVFAIQEDIAKAIAGALRAPLGLAAGERLVSSRTEDVDSYREFVRGRALLRDRVLDEAITTLESAIARDPNYAPAWALLAQARRSLLEYSPLSRRADIPLAEARAFVQATLDQAEQAARRAIELDPRHDGGYAALAYVEGTRGHWNETDALFAQAFAIDADNPEALYRYAQSLSLVGRLGESLQTFERLLTLEPLVPIYRFQTASSLYVNGRNQASIEMLDATSDDSPARYYRNRYRAAVYAAVGRYADAADAILSLQGEPQVTNEGLDVAAGLIRTPTAVESPASLPALGDFSFVYAYIGADERLLDTYERGLEVGNVSQIQIIWSPSLAKVRQTQRFKTLVRDVGLVDYWRAHGWPDLCRPQGDTDFACD